jgi:hypothetical protein
MAEPELYLIRKYVLASSALEAIKLDRKTPVAEVTLVDEKTSESKMADAVGFNVVHPDED